MTFWIGYTLLLGGVLPLLLLLIMSDAHAHKLPTWDAAFGGGDWLLLAVAWLAGGIAELRDASKKRQASAEFLQWASIVFLFSTALLYGYLRGSPNFLSEHAVSVSSTGVVALSAVVSLCDVAVGTHSEDQ